MASSAPIVSLAPVSLFFPLGGVQLAREDSHLGQGRGVDQHLGDQGHAVERQLGEDVSGGLKTNRCQHFFVSLFLSRSYNVRLPSQNTPDKRKTIRADM